MSAVKTPIKMTQAYAGDVGFFFEEAEQMYQIVSTHEVSRNGRSILNTIRAEVVGLTISGILSIIGLFVLLSFGYPILSLLFIVPLLGVAIGAVYIAYMRKHDS